MEEKCRNCSYINYDKKYKNMWGETLYYCEAEHKDVRMDWNRCTKYKPVKKDDGDWTPSGCYITTIVCDILGYPDDCELLTTLRGFRDNYLKRHPEYLGLLVEYDKVGPLISKGIYEEDNSYTFALGLLDYFLIPCAEAIKNNEFEKAISMYQNMVIYLNDEFELPMVSIDENATYDMETLGKGRVRTSEC